MQLDLLLPKDRFLIGETISLLVTLTNTDAQPIQIPDPFHSDNWQPTYTITGPSYPEGYTFSFRSVAVKDPRPNPDDVKPILTTFQPKETVESDVPLHEWAPMIQPGQYTLIANHSWNNVSSAAKPIQFQLQASSPKSISVGIDVGEIGTGYWVDWFEEATGPTPVYTALFQEPVVDQRGFEPFSIDPLPNAGPEATDLLTPWTNYSRQNSFTKWRAWRQKSTLFAMSYGDDSAQKLPLPIQPCQFIRPSLQVSSGELDIFMLNPEGNELLLARFSRTVDPAILWRTALPVPAGAGRCILSPALIGNDRHISLISEDDNSVLIHHANLAGASSPSTFQSHSIPGSSALPNSEPAIRVDPDGTTHIALLLLSNRAQRLLALAQVTFDKDGQPSGTPVIDELGELETIPTAATTVFDTVSGSTALAWTLLLPDGQLIHSGSGLKSVSLSAAPTNPLQVVIVQQTPYVLCTNPPTGPLFLPLISQ